MGGAKKFFRTVVGKTSIFVKSHVCCCSRSFPVHFGRFVVLCYVCVI